MIGNKTPWAVFHLLPPEIAHEMALLALRLPTPPIFRLAQDPFDWRGLRFRNRVGIAAGFDKNAVALHGVRSLGAGFVEVGTILVKPWPGNEVRPRIRRIPGSGAIWNRLGFPSLGLEKVRKNLKGSLAMFDAVLSWDATSDLIPVT